MYVDLKGTGLVLENVIALTEVTVMLLDMIIYFLLNKHMWKIYFLPK